MIEASDLILTAFFTGIGIVFGQALGNWLKEKVKKHGTEMTSKKKLQEIGKLIKDYLDDDFSDRE